MEKIFYSTWSSWPKKTLYKLLLTMKITTLLLILGTLNSFALNSYSQTAVVSLNLKNASVEQVLNEIEKKSEFFFLFNQKLVDVSKKVDIDAKNATIKDILANLFEGEDVGYIVYDKQIILAPKSTVNGVVSSVQQNTVQGSVIDASTGEALPGVNVVIEGTTSGVVTDLDGKYTLTLNTSNATLIFSYVGYLTQKVAYTGQPTIDVKLSPDITNLEEVVVVGYGTLQKRDLTSSVTTVRSEDLLQGAFNSPLQMVEGKIAGVTISNPAAADPNRGTDIQVRGASSIDAGIGPLLIIDGMPGGDLRNIAQQDIESITVLKDGSAAAIYGSRAANGVILIQTKRGKSGKVTVTYDSFIDHDVVAKKPDILSAEEFLAHKIDTDQGYRTNWYDELVRKDNMGQNHFLAVSGGNENTIFRISGNFREKTAIDIASERKESGIRANFQQKALNGLLEFGGNLSYKTAKEEYTNYGVFQQAVKLNPTLPIWDPNNPSKYAMVYGYDVYNPVQELNARENGADQTYSIIDFNVKLNILKNLNTELKVARQDHDQYKREYYSSKAKESIDNNRTGRARLQDEKWTDLTLEWIGNYFTTINKHDIKLMGGYSYQEFNNHGYWAENMDFPSDAFNYNNLGAGKWNNEDGRLGMDSWKSKEKTIAFFGRANYSYDDKYLLMGTLRYEGNTKFGADHKWGMFPAISAAWRISKLSALENVSAINDLKIRLSYGETGRSGFGRYSALARYQDFGKWQNDEGQWIPVYGPSNNPNPDLHWEKQLSYNAGVDFSLFSNRLSGSFDMFIRKGKDVISNYDAPLPPFLHDQIFTNVASTSAKGAELMVNWTVIDKEDFRYNTNVSFAYVKSKLDKFSNGTFNKGFMTRYNLPSPGNPGPAQRLEDGVEIGSFYGYKYAGVNEQGQILIWKEGKEGTEKVVASSSDAKETDKTYLGHGAPRYELTWGNAFNYKGFDLTLYFRGRFDYQILNLYQMYYGLTAEPNVNLLKDAFGKNAHIKSGKVMTDYFLENGDYFKLDNLTLGWTAPIKNNYISNIRIYGSIRNVFTITKYSGLDPTTVNITGLEPGIGDLNVYPIARNYTLGLQVTF